MAPILDGLKSVGAAVAAAFLCLVPAVLSVLALRAGAVPGWLVWPGWIAAAGLAGVGVVLAAAFGRKAWRGVSPSRSRRR